MVKDPLKHVGDADADFQNIDRFIAVACGVMSTVSFGGGGAPGEVIQIFMKNIEQYYINK